MELFEAILYGIIQGITEFLPVSSSAHLAVLPKFLKIQDPGVTFDLLMHAGTAFAVLLYFYKDVGKLFKGLPGIFKKDTPQTAFLKNYLIATIVTVVVALLIKDYAKTVGRKIELISLNLVVFGLLLFLCDLFRKRDRELGKMDQGHFLRALLLGFGQALAVFPGVSRSGITISVGILCGLNKTEASRFSFLLSLPIILGGMVLLMPEFLSNPNTPSLAFSLSAFFTSFIVGILSIHFFLKWMLKWGFWPFCLYRIAFGILLLYLF
jgi:undecaprenyl-diphosphatase